MKSLAKAACAALLLCTPAHAEFVVLPAMVESKAFRQIAKELDSEGVLQEFAKALNETLDVPVKLGLRFAECGEANAYYDPESKQVLMCFELLQSYYENLADQYETKDELDEAVSNAFVFVFFHEIGHALVDALELPVTGREEDAVDQLSAWVLIDNNDGDRTVLDGALSFYVFDDETDDDSDFSDEHSFNKQRFYNMVCWVYGSDPKKYGYLVGEEEDDWLPEARADGCASEYRTLDRSWSRLLADHIKEDGEAVSIDEAPPRQLGAGKKSD